MCQRGFCSSWTLIAGTLSADLSSKMLQKCKGTTLSTCPYGLNLSLTLLFTRLSRFLAWWPPSLSFSVFPCFLLAVETFLGLQRLFSSRTWSGTPVSVASSCLCSQSGLGGVTGFVETHPSDLWTPWHLSPSLWPAVLSVILPLNIDNTFSYVSL